MKGELIERRQKMVRQRAKGLPLNIVVNQLSQEYTRTKQALYKDWRNRKTWIKGILDLDDPETVFFDFYARHEEIYQMTVMEYYKADNSSAKIGALRLLRDLNRDFYEISITPHLLKRLEDLEGKAKKGVFIK